MDVSRGPRVEEPSHLLGLSVKAVVPSWEVTKGGGTLTTTEIGAQ